MRDWLSFPTLSAVDHCPPFTHAPLSFEPAPLSLFVRQVLSAGLMFTLCRNPEHEKNRADYVKQFATEG